MYTYAFHLCTQRPDGETEEKVQALKQEVRKMLQAAAHHQPQQQLKLINDIQRLGVAYHFEAEIEAALSKINDIYPEVCGSETEDGLHMISLCFRLLRQHGFNVPSG